MGKPLLAIAGFVFALGYCASRVGDADVGYVDTLQATRRPDGSVQSYSMKLKNGRTFQDANVETMGDPISENFSDLEAAAKNGTPVKVRSVWLYHPDNDSQGNLRCPCASEIYSVEPAD